MFLRFILGIRYTIHLSAGRTAVSRQDDPHLSRLPPFLRQRCTDRQVFSSHSFLLRRHRPGCRPFHENRSSRMTWLVIIWLYRFCCRPKVVIIVSWRVLLQRVARRNTSALFLSDRSVSLSIRFSGLPDLCLDSLLQKASEKATDKLSFLDRYI